MPACSVGDLIETIASKWQISSGCARCNALPLVCLFVCSLPLVHVAIYQFIYFFMRYFHCYAFSKLCRDSLPDTRATAGCMQVQERRLQRSDVLRDEGGVLVMNCVFNPSDVIKPNEEKRQGFSTPGHHVQKVCRGSFTYFRHENVSSCFSIFCFFSVIVVSFLPFRIFVEFTSNF